MLLKRSDLKNLLAICAISILCFIILGVLFYRRGSQIVIAQTKNDAMRIARAAASSINGDDFAAIDSQDSPHYKYVYDELSKYKATEDFEFIYAMKKLGDKEIVFIVDTDEEDPADFYEPYEWLDSMAPAFNGHTCSDDEFTSDEWGTYLSGYSPIFDSRDMVVGIIGCDVNTNTINERLFRLRVLVILLGIIPNAVLLIMLEPKASDFDK